MGVSSPISKRTPRDNLELICRVSQQGSMCCGYGSKGTDTKGFDCIMIPGASKAATALTPTPNQSFCGKSQGLFTGTKTGAGSKTVCSKSILRQSISY